MIQLSRMVHIPERLSLNSMFKVVFGKVMLGFLLLVNTCKGQSLVTNQPQLVTAIVGEDVVLPCHLEVPVNVDELVLEWGRLDLNPRLVYVWFEGSEYTDDQNTAYSGRTSLFTDRLSDGDVSLRLMGVRLSDNARFRCYDPKENKEYFIDLLVGSVSSPAISLTRLDARISGVMLDCRSAGWYPEPEIFWLDGEGSIMSAGAVETTSGHDGLYTVSSRVTVEKRHKNNITCRVQQKNINQTRETHFYVLDGSFVPQPDCSVSISFTVILGIMVPLGAAAFCWKWRQSKILVKNLKEREIKENQQLLKGEKQNLAMKKSNLEEDQRIIDQLFEALMMMSEELKEQKKRLTDQKEEAEKMAQDNDRKLKAVDEEVENHKGNKKEKKAQGYLKLAEIITESNDRLDKRKQSHQQMELMTQKLISRTSNEVTKLKERKQELEKHVEEIKTQLKEMETQI